MPLQIKVMNVSTNSKCIIISESRLTCRSWFFIVCRKKMPFTNNIMFPWNPSFAFVVTIFPFYCQNPCFFPVFINWEQMSTSIWTARDTTTSVWHFNCNNFSTLKRKTKFTPLFTTQTKLNAGPAAWTGSAGWPYNLPAIWQLAATHYNTTKLLIVWTVSSTTLRWYSLFNSKNIGRWIISVGPVVLEFWSILLLFFFLRKSIPKDELSVAKWRI